MKKRFKKKKPVLHISLNKYTGISKRNHVNSLRCKEKTKPGEDQRKAERVKGTGAETVVVWWFSVFVVNGLMACSII